MQNDLSLFVHDNRSWIDLCEENGRPMTKEVVDYGEGFEGMARHVSDMSCLDRVVFEDCCSVSGKVTAPHLNLTPYPHWLCPEYVARKAGCELKQAVDLLDCWVILDADRRMVETFISWVEERGADKALPYFERLAMALAEVENVDPEDATEPEGPEYDAPDLYAYHPVGEYCRDGEPKWMDRQPDWYRDLIAEVKACPDLDTLRALGKDVYAKDLTHDQAGVFWTEYNLAKGKLERQVKLGSAARSFVARIAKANGNLGSLGAWLYRAQQGKVKVANPPTRNEWTVIWKAYGERKLQHGQVAV